MRCPDVWPVTPKAPRQQAYVLGQSAVALLCRMSLVHAVELASSVPFHSHILQPYPPTLLTNSHRPGMGWLSRPPSGSPAKQ
ncbi:hypothetical protein M431DRAFT_438540 [Trichoderma harzianum CBS 226.95]|uniref:Uncharacterized protein n=1 Tax=Trichoderma harzianum CBS 226.95 TaxID=983964 RepID=A0A2T4ADM0_TRIHA|nr:hypothetical protein M431DRAFT_438540 [Trichoderma harzianum CBS 226.95]PTB55177.1 hypothetical protein M431DRAFT_438540 [Trichoderma harzianum CBS 226.95]